MTERSVEAIRFALIAVCAAIVVGDWGQPVLLDWRPKMVGAILGGGFYAVCAFAIWRRLRPAAIAVACLPVLPIGLLSAHALGASVPVEPDTPMRVILVGQVCAAILAIAWLRSDHGRTI